MKGLQVPSSTYWGMQHLNANVLCAVDIELTGPDPINHELIEICILPLDRMLRPHSELMMFNMKMIPEQPENIDYTYCRLSRSDVARVGVTGFNNMKVADLFVDWFERMSLNIRKKIIPISHNYASKLPIIRDWLGHTAYNDIFDEDYRDTLVATHYLNDRESSRAEVPPFSKQGLRWIAKRFNIPIIEAGGSCMTDCKTIAEVYGHLLRM